MGIEMKKAIAVLATGLLLLSGCDNTEPASTPTTTAATTTSAAPVEETAQAEVTTEEAPAAEEAPPAEEAPAPATTTRVHYSSCAEAKEAGAAPLYKGDPGYSSTLDRDGDGVACES